VTIEPKPHPAKFTPSILEALQHAVTLETQARGRPLLALDPFAGTGLVHTLEGVTTWGVEIEPEWAVHHPRTIVGDATRLPFPADTFDLLVTSPTYGNRMADLYDGRDGTRRYTYRLSLGRRPHHRNTAAMQWGTGYWHTHWAAWVECRRVLKPGGLIVLNVSDSIRGKELIHVVAWHRARWQELGATLEDDLVVHTPRMRHGANHKARVDGEHLLTLRMPDPSLTPNPKEPR
jgi:SAM-dependent methyltransferase